MTTPPKQSPLLALTYPVAFVTGALIIGILAGGWLVTETASSASGPVADLAEP
ncbi:hypothetical protein [Methylobacterium nodulans]|uniref:Uncharacterized protein n=1 Tax=Methylobacterium nodulans (strain LMG 21967 / CNCM I-2342 / ORS 2060) TaxID=460265 RepID=B8IMR8_METNO|nr:hypothetical protein [Methylobacterium nodulans]ACL60261.1 conserved hypothetical protein [Methylobacterium nodulans ORS 2060]